MKRPDTMNTAHLQPPPPSHEGEPAPTVEDPTAGGYLCGSNRSPRQIEAAREEGIENPWPWCRNRAGKGTDHAGYGRCKLHGGASPGGRRAAEIKAAELVMPAWTTLARAMVDPKAPWAVRVRAADSVLDRNGWPRRLDVDVDAARENLVERIAAATRTDEAQN